MKTDDLACLAFANGVTALLPKATRRNHDPILDRIVVKQGEAFPTTIQKDRWYRVECTIKNRWIAYLCYAHPIFGWGYIMVDNNGLSGL